MVVLIFSISSWSVLYPGQETAIATHDCIHELCLKSPEYEPALSFITYVQKLPHLNTHICVLTSILCTSNKGSAEWARLNQHCSTIPR